MAVTGNLNSHAISGSLWSFLEKFSALIVQFVVGIILARLLDPKDYGLVALAMIFTGVSAAITDGGFEKSLIHKQNLSELQISTVFYVNTVLGLIMMATLVIAAPPLSVFFREPQLTPVLQVVSAGIFINAVGQTPSALLRKEFGFKKISVAHIAGSVIGGAMGLTLAFNGYGVWALVFSTLISQVVMLIGYLFFSSWRPKLAFSFASIEGMLPYGLNILYSSVLFFSVQQFNNFIIGRFYDKSELGLYHRGGRFPELIISIIEGVVLKMAFPLFARIQDQNDKLIEMLENTIRTLAFITFPLMTILFVNASDVTIVLFTDKWAGSIVYLQFFCLVRLFYPFIIIYKEVLLVRGEAKLSARMITVFSVCEVVLVLFLVRFGIVYMIISTLAIAAIQCFLYAKIVSMKVNLTIWQQVKWIRTYMLICLIVLGCTYGMDYLLNGLNHLLFLKLVIKVAIGLMLYLILAYVFKVNEIAYLKAGYLRIQKSFQGKAAIS